MSRIRQLGELFEFIHETLPSAIARVWVRIYLRKRYPDEQERKYVAHSDFVSLHSKFKLRVISFLPWFWAVLFLAFIATSLFTTFN